MTKQTLYKVMKLPISTISRSKQKNPSGASPLYDLGSYSFEKASAKGEMVAVGDHLLFRKIRDYYGITKSPDEIFIELQDISRNIRKLKTRKSTKAITREILALEKQRQEITYVKDIINVTVTNKELYESVALNRFMVNGITYKRFCCGSGQMRRNTVTFVNEQLYEYLLEHLMCGLYGRIESISLAKFSAYFALSASSVLWVRKPGICVIPDLETTLQNQNIDFIVKAPDGTKRVEPRIMNLTLNSCDGEGLISPKCAEWFSQDMGLDYTCCQFVVRTAFVKGCLLTFDFKSYLKNVCKVDKIQSIYGEWFCVDEIDVLLTESMFKMHAYFTSVREYQEYHDQYGLHWGIARYNKKQDDDYCLLNYQYIQNNRLDDQDIQNLTAMSVDWFKKICSGDKFYSILYAVGPRKEDLDFRSLQDSCGSIHTKAIVQNSRMLEDGYVRRKIYDSIKENFRQAKLGRIWCRGGYQFMLADPIPLLRNAAGLDPTGMIPAGHVYSAYWNSYHPDEIDACRSPMVDRHEHNILKLADSPAMGHWYKYLYSGIVYSIYDTSTIRHSDSDFDGDIVFTTDNKELINGAYRNHNPITYDKEKAPRQAFTYENTIQCDLNGFDTLVGQITNNSTSLNAMLPLFLLEKKPREHTEILTRLKLLREIIGAEIDKIKLGVAPEFPKEWVERVKIDPEHDPPEVIEEKKIRNSLVICKKPYFMIYLYDSLNNAYRNHVRQFNLDCRTKYGMSFHDLTFQKDKTPEQIRFINKANYFSPVLDTPCVMNKICHQFERLQDTIAFDKSFEESVLPEFRNHTVIVNKKKLDQLLIYYKEYKSRRKFSYIKKLLNDLYTKDELAEFTQNMMENLCREYRQKCYEISTNPTDLFQYMIRLPDLLSKFDYTFIWDILGDDILAVIPRDNSILYKESETGQEYLGRKYEVMEVNYTSDHLG